jgi:hypothetical protein
MEEKKGKDGVGGEVRGDRRGEKSAYARIGGNDFLPAIYYQEGQISRSKCPLSQDMPR